MKKMLFLLAIAGAYIAGQADLLNTPKLQNAKVTVTELDYDPGKPRPKSVRPSDQVIVFLDDSRYERIDPDTGAKEVRTRKSGDVIWHNKGEIAPVLTNLGSTRYRTLVVAIK